jgi:hypothetical protein
MVESDVLDSMAKFVDQRLQSGCCDDSETLASLSEVLTDWNSILSAIYRLDLTNTDAATEVVLLTRALRLCPLSLLLRSKVGEAYFRASAANSALVKDSVREGIRGLRQRLGAAEWPEFWKAVFNVIENAQAGRKGHSSALAAACAGKFGGGSELVSLLVSEILEKHRDQDEWLQVVQPWMSRPILSAIEKEQVGRVAARYFHGQVLKSFLSACGLSLP